VQIENFWLSRLTPPPRQRLVLPMTTVRGQNRVTIITFSGALDPRSRGPQSRSRGPKLAQITGTIENRVKIGSNSEISMNPPLRSRGPQSRSRGPRSRSRGTQTRSRGPKLAKIRGAGAGPRRTPAYFNHWL